MKSKFYNILMYFVANEITVLLHFPLIMWPMFPVHIFPIYFLFPMLLRLYPSLFILYSKIFCFIFMKFFFLNMELIFSYGTKYSKKTLICANYAKQNPNPTCNIDYKIPIWLKSIIRLEGPNHTIYFGKLHICPKFFVWFGPSSRLI